MQKRHVIVVGGGASGLVAAIVAARNDAHVTILEQKEKLGKKILSTGNGKCNLTNTHMEQNCFRSDDTSILAPVLERFGYKDTLNFFEELGVILKDRNGYVYPISDQATTIVDVLCMEVERLGIDVKLEECVTNIIPKKAQFQVKTNHASYKADAVILATGGKAAPVLGSDGSGYALAKSFGHSIVPVVPALVQLKGTGRFYKQVSGVRTQAKVSLYVDGVCLASDTGELQLTNYGISGIPVFQISRFAAKGFYEKKDVFAELDFIPSMSEETWKSYMMERREKHGSKKAADFLIGVFHQKLIGLLLKASRIDETATVSEISESDFFYFLDRCKHFKTGLDSANSFEQAQICAGGVCTTEVDAVTMESKKCNHLYITGELLDVDGICGGYNLQWAWSTGYLAGYHAAKGV